MDKNYYYYEIIGADLFEIDPAKLFVETRKTEVVRCRQLMMKYRKEELGYSLAKAAARYGKDHATAIHAIKKINSFCDIYKDFWALVLDFNERCAQEHDVERPVKVIEREPIEALSFKETVANALKRMNTLTYYLNMALNDNESEPLVIEQIVKCKDDLDVLYEILNSNKIKYVIDNKRVVDKKSGERVEACTSN